MGLNFLVDQQENIQKPSCVFTLGYKTQWLSIQLHQDCRDENMFVVYITLNGMATSYVCTLSNEPFQVSFGVWHRFSLSWMGKSTSMVSTQGRVINVEIDGVALDAINLPDLLQVASIDRARGSTYTDIGFSNPATGSKFMGYVNDVTVHDLSIVVYRREREELIAESRARSERRAAAAAGPGVLTVPPLSGTYIAMATPTGTIYIPQPSATQPAPRITAPTQQPVTTFASIPSDQPRPVIFPQARRCMLTFAITDMRTFKTTDIEIDSYANIAKLIRAVCFMLKQVSVDSRGQPEIVDPARVKLRYFGRLISNTEASLADYGLTNFSVLELDLR